MTQSVLITGAGTGLGLATALALAVDFDVYAAVLNEDQRIDVEAELVRHGRTVRVLLLDITNKGAIDAAVATIVAQSGGVDALVNNAGISLRGYFEDLEEDEIRRVFEVNLFGALAMTRAVLPHMRAAGRGRIVFISSIGGRIASMARTAYCASKFGLEGFAESLMQEIAPLGLQVSIVEPAIIKTERWTVNRGIAKGANNPQSAYYHWFCEQEKLADTLVRTSPTTAADVTAGVRRALTDVRPRLRYVVGSRARLVLALRQYLPGELFERLYFGAAMWRVTRGQRPMIKVQP